MLAIHGSNGVAVPTTAALTSLGYSGEHFDAKAQQQYLRARWYDPANGRFNRLDPFDGNMQDPQSLHKYAYVHGDPVQGVDPTGLMSLGSMISGIGIGMGQRAKSAGSSLYALTRVTLKFARPYISGFLGITLPINAGMDWRNRILKQSAFGTGGRDATAKLGLLRNDVINTWNGLQAAQKQQIVDELYHPIGGWVNWDIAEMIFNQKALWTNAVAAPAVEDTLTYRGQVFPVADVNYVLWGLVNRLAYEDGIDVSLTNRATSLSFVAGYRTASGGVWAIKDTAEDLWLHGFAKHRYDTIYGRVAWANYGWDWAANANAVHPVTEDLPLATPNQDAWGNPLSWGAGEKPRFFSGSV